MYYLMNKDQVVAAFDMERGFLSNQYAIQRVWGKLPYGSENLNQWLEGRKASKHNQKLRQLMASCGCEKTEGYIRMTHAATLNDTFWVKSEKEDISWENVSLYRNQFDAVISKLAFEGIGLY